MFSFPKQYGGIQKGIPVLNKSLQVVSTQPGLSIDNGSIAYDFMDEEFIRNCEHFLPDQSKHIVSWNINYEFDTCKFSLYRKVF